MKFGAEAPRSRTHPLLPLMALMLFLPSCTKTTMSTLPAPGDYLSWVRHHLMQPDPAFTPCRAGDASDAAKLLDDVLILSRVWRPPPGANYELRVAPNDPLVLQLRVSYRAPGGPIEIRSDGMGVLHILERAEEPTIDDVSRLAQAMFGEFRHLADADAAKRRPFSLQMLASDSEGTRFQAVTPGMPPQPPVQWIHHTTDFFGGLIAGRRVELISLAGEIDNFGPRTAGPPPTWEPSDLAPDLPGETP